jgi:hypothetical protein
MYVPMNPKQIQVFNEMAQFYKCFIKNFAFIMASIIKLTRKIKQFLWTSKCQTSWELIKQKYVETHILIFLNWDVEFHVHTNAFLLAIGAMLTLNLT